MVSPMSVPLRLLSFAVALVGVFFLAAAVGGFADLGESAPAGHVDEAMSGHVGDAMAEHGAEIDPVRGLAVSENAMTLELNRTSAPNNRRFLLRFGIRGADGELIRDFDVENAKRMHLIIARRDLTAFQHLHPLQAADGSWSAPVRLGEPGTYRVFADFSTDDAPATLGADLTVDGDVERKPLPPPASSFRVDGMRVEMSEGVVASGEESELDFEITRHGEPVEIQPYLGAQGHLVALREGDLAFLHVHPDEDSLSFMSEFPSAGRYRLFLQFKTDGRVHTAEFTQGVRR